MSNTNETLKPFQQQYINSTLFTAIQNAGSVLAAAGLAVAADAGSLVSSTSLYTASVQNAGSVLAAAGVAVAADAGSLVSSTSLYTAGTVLTTDITAQAGSIAVAAEQVISLVQMMGSVLAGTE